MESNVERDKRQLIQGLLLIVATYALAMELPYIGRSISQLLIPTIRIGNGALYLSGLLPLVPWIYGYKCINRSGYFKSKLLVFLGVIFLVGPIISDSIEYTKLPVYALNSDARSIEIKDSKMSVTGYNGVLVLDFECRFRNHKNIHDSVDVVLTLPESMEGIINETTYLVRSYDYIYNRDDKVVQFESEVMFADGRDFDDLIDSRYYEDEYLITFVVNDEAVKNVRHRTLGD